MWYKIFDGRPYFTIVFFFFIKIWKFIKTERKARYFIRLSSIISRLSASFLSCRRYVPYGNGNWPFGAVHRETYILSFFFHRSWSPVRKRLFIAIFNGRVSCVGPCIFVLLVLLTQNLSCETPPKTILCTLITYVVA